jgi:hypothetical protein
MKVKVEVIKEIEVEVNGSAIERLDEFWRNAEPPVPHSAELDALVDEAVREVEQATGLTFCDGPRGSDTGSITAVYAMDGDPIIEW